MQSGAPAGWATRRLCRLLSQTSGGHLRGTGEPVTAVGSRKVSDGAQTGCGKLERGQTLLSRVLCNLQERDRQIWEDIHHVSPRCGQAARIYGLCKQGVKTPWPCRESAYLPDCEGDSAPRPGRSFCLRNSFPNGRMYICSWGPALTQPDGRGRRPTGRSETSSPLRVSDSSKSVTRLVAARVCVHNRPIRASFPHTTWAILLRSACELHRLFG